MVAVPSPRRHLGMADAGGPSETSGGHGPNDLPVMPGPEKPLLHLAIEFVEMLEHGVAKRLRCFNYLNLTKSTALIIC